MGKDFFVGKSRKRVGDFLKQDIRLWLVQLAVLVYTGVLHDCEHGILEISSVLVDFLRHAK